MVFKSSYLLEINNKVKYIYIYISVFIGKQNLNGYISNCQPWVSGECRIGVTEREISILYTP